MLAPAYFHILPSIDATAKQPVSLQRNSVAVNSSMPLPMINQHSGDVPDASSPRISSGQPKVSRGTIYFFPRATFGYRLEAILDWQPEAIRFLHPPPLPFKRLCTQQVSECYLMYFNDI